MWLTLCVNIAFCIKSSLVIEIPLHKLLSVLSYLWYMFSHYVDIHGDFLRHVKHCHSPSCKSFVGVFKDIPSSISVCMSNGYCIHMVDIFCFQLSVSITHDYAIVTQMEPM